MINAGQKQIVENIEGIYLVDAGAGTGKTFAITKRYENMLSKGISPQKILLVTFTNNAAESMKEKIITECSEKYDIKTLIDAPILTFHSFCNSLLKKKGFKSPEFLGISEGLAGNYQITENNVLEERMFKRFFARFQKDNISRYNEIFSLIDNRSDIILSLIKKMCCSGIFPERNGWFNNGYELISGNKKMYLDIFDRLNASRLTEKGNASDSAIASSFKTKLRYKIYKNTPEEDFVFQNKQIRKELAEISFDEDRNSIISFVHDVYFAYLEHSVKRNHLNFDFMAMLAFILLYKDHRLREQSAFDYVIVDEFQDTNEIQFMLTLLLMKKNNLCAVGDWKQGIYGFRNATIENITDFGKRLDCYINTLNHSSKRVNFLSEYSKISFDINYRSSQKILDFSERSLLSKGSEKDELDVIMLRSRITHLKSGMDFGTKTKIEFIQSAEEKDEAKAILQKVQEIKGNPDYTILEHSGDSYKERLPDYRDIAVLSRTRTFGLRLQNLAIKHNMPLNYDGGIELFKTEQSILLLAWLRALVNPKKKKAWLVILEKEGYSYLEAKKILDNSEKDGYPENLSSFLKTLEKIKGDISQIIGKVFGFYGLEDHFSNAIITETEKAMRGSMMSISDLIYFIEQNITAGQTYNIGINNSDNAVTVETIHAAKGLEYPVVLIVDCNESRFPARNIGEPDIFYDEVLGLRLKKHKARKNSYDYIFNNISTDLLLTKLHSDFDEERRLLYVASTRAKQYLVFTANKNPSSFFKELSAGFHISLNEKPNITAQQEDKTESYGDIAVRPYTKTGNIFSVHQFMDIENCGEGTDKGKHVHWFAERIAKGLPAEDDFNEAGSIKKFIQSLGSRLMPEVLFALPLNNNLVRGKIDLISISQKGIDIIDYKTDTDDRNEKEYAKQLSFYYHAVKGIYPEENVRCGIYYVSKDRFKIIEPLSKERLINLVLEMDSN